MAVDVGGTFTDIIVDDGGRLEHRKVLTRRDAAELGIAEALAGTGADPRTLTRFVHGTTFVINALLERRGARTALITTEGFRDILEIGRGARPQTYNAFYHRAAPLVPRQLRFTVAERTSSTGEVLRAPDPDEIARLCEVLREERVQAVAVALLNSHENAGNEQAVAEAVRRLLPECYVTCSSELTRQWREYERFTTATANAYVGPQVHGYLERLRRTVVADAPAADFFLLDSNGGALPVELAGRLPLRLIESGPVGGILGARVACQHLGVHKAVAFDMGGTTAKCSVIVDDHVEALDIYWLGGYDEGLPLRVPCVDIVEVGAGGGSVAWVDPVGRLHVGPRSAGAQPGPACYGRGGEEFTVTDANVVCGRLGPDEFLGELTLDADASRKAAAALAGGLGVDIDRAAAGVLSVGTLTVANAVRRQTLQRGLDPREFALVAYGGGGALHACEVAGVLGMRTILVPPSPGTFAAQGMLTAAKRFDTRQALRCPLDRLDPEALLAVVAAGREQLAASLAEEPDAIGIEVALGMRYVGQEFTVDVPLVDLAADRLTATALRGGFEDLYRRLYGRVDEHSEVEAVDVFIAGQARRPAPAAARSEPAAPSAPSAPSGPSDVDVPADRRRRVWLGGEDWGDCDIVARPALTGAGRRAGPAIVYEYGAVTFVAPGWSVEAIESGWLRCERDRSAGTDSAGTEA